MAGDSNTRQVVMFQDFNWHDASEEGEYAYGKDGYLSMEGSAGRIKSCRFLKKKIVDCSGGLAVKMRVVLGKRYYIRLFDEADGLVVDCLIDPQGWVKFRKGDHYVNTQQYVTWGVGYPCVDPAFSRPAWYAVETDDVVYKFDNFDFEEGRLDFTIAEPSLKETITMDGCLTRGARDICRLELQTIDVDPGTRIRLAHYDQYENDVIIDHEEFPHYWKPIPAPPDGYPSDNICQTTLRPVDNRWLETSTFYGWVRTSIPLVAEGELEFEMITPDVAIESVVQLGYSGCDSLMQRLQESRECTMYCPISVGIIHNKFCAAIPKRCHSGVINKDFNSTEFYYFDEPLPVSHQVYKIKVAWLKSRQYQFWIDDAAMEINGSRDIPICCRNSTDEFNGIDTIFLHPGHSDSRATLAEKKAGKRSVGQAGALERPHLTYWGRFRLMRNAAP